MQTSPAFGEADLTNCERELIHFAGSVQPHGVLLVLRASDLEVLQASANAGALFGSEVLAGADLRAVAPGLAQRLQAQMASTDLTQPVPVAAALDTAGGRRRVEGTVHRQPGRLVLELEPVDDGDAVTVALAPALLQSALAAAVQRFSHASTTAVLSDAAVQCVRDLTGYDRVMVYKFDPDGHGKVIAEARHPRLEPLLGHHYPASDIPQRARELYLRNRVRVLVDVHSEQAPLQPRRLPAAGGGGEDLDMSLCYLRSMSPLHIQYLKNMGVTATLVMSLVREGRLWGLVACHHYAPRNLRWPLRAACELLAEVIATRIAAIENYMHAQVALLVRRLEQRLIEATSQEGDWRHALLRRPQTLLSLSEATGAALFHAGEVMTTGEVPSTPELRALCDWVSRTADGPLVECGSLARANAALASLTPTASGVLAVRLSDTRADWLMWFRKEQLQTVTWAGDPYKPMLGSDPRELSPRRSFAAWSELVRGTAQPWTRAEAALARAIGRSLVDIILQVHAVRLLVAERQRAQVRATVEASREAVVIADARGRVLLANAAFIHLAGCRPVGRVPLESLAQLFTAPAQAFTLLQSLYRHRQPWKGELAIARADAGDAGVPVRISAEAIAGPDGMPLGVVVTFSDLSDSRRAAAARRHLEQSLEAAALGLVGRAPATGDAVLGTILSVASVAAMDIADGFSDASIVPLLEEVESSAQRAALLYQRIVNPAADP